MRLKGSLLSDCNIDIGDSNNVSSSEWSNLVDVGAIPEYDSESQLFSSSDESSSDYNCVHHNQSVNHNLLDKNSHTNMFDDGICEYYLFVSFVSISPTYGNDIKYIK